jgi:hypothetical protein
LRSLSAAGIALAIAVQKGEYAFYHDAVYNSFNIMTGERVGKMSKDKGHKFSDKHKAAEKPNTEIKNQIEKRSKNNEIPCAVAFEVVEDLGVLPAEVGKTIDLMNYKLVKCQLGLFGYKPEKKIVIPQDTPNHDLKNAIQKALANEGLPCITAWEIAARFHVSKMTVSGIAEAMGIKIKPCQLGAF